ncbi:MAG: chitobiase/beta-hexosaminidase C-terminal domain-containing protein [Treponema sp.]|nr:chitobiase/beta-hexosaminidase C-terminal domain-containing protein [Treponema sp.]
MKINTKGLFKALALAAASVFTLSACSGGSSDSSVRIEPVVFSVESGDIPENDYVTLSCDTEDATIGWSYDEFTEDDWQLVNLNESTRIQITASCSIYAIAYDDNNNHSSITSATYTAIPVPVKPVFTTSAAADTNGKYAKGTTVTITSTSSIKDDEITIYYTTNGVELTKANAETSGTVYEAGTVITLDSITTISAIAKNANGWSPVNTQTFDIPVAYAEGAFDFDGNIQEAVDAILNETTFNLTLSGYVTSAANKVSSGKPYIYIQDKNAGIQVYGIPDNSSFAVGDYVTVESVTAGEIYNTSGSVEVTAFGTITADASRVTRVIYFKKIPSYTCDFTDYYGHGMLLHGFRGTTSEHTTSPDYIYTYSSANTDEEKINLGPVVKAGGEIQFTLWSQLDTDDTILAVDTPEVENVQYAIDGTAVSGYYPSTSKFYTAGSTVKLSCDTTDVDIYYSTEKFTVSEFDKTNTEKFTQGTTITLTEGEDLTVYAIAVNSEGVTSPGVKMAQYLTPFDTTFVELSESNNYDFDGNLASCVSGSIDADTTYSGVIVAFNGTADNNFLIQDKNAGVYMWKTSLPANARVGSKISFKPSSSTTYNGLFEVTATDVTVDDARYSDEIYYINLTCSSDFKTDSGDKMQLCAVVGYVSDYTSSAASIYPSYSDKEMTCFGYTYEYSKSNTYQLVRLVTFDEAKIAYPADYVANPRFSTSGVVASNTEISFSCIYPTSGVVYWYQFIAETDTETVAMTKETYTTAGTQYVEGETVLSITEAGTLYAIAVNGEYTSEVVSASYTVDNRPTETIDFTEVSSLPTETTYSTLTWNKTATQGVGENTGSTQPAYNSSNQEARLYRYNSLIIASSTKTIASVTLTFTSSSYAGSDFTSYPDTYELSENIGTWTGSANSIEFVNTGTSNVQTHIKSIVITYAE